MLNIWTCVFYKEQKKSSINEDLLLFLFEFLMCFIEGT